MKGAYRAPFVVQGNHRRLAVALTVALAVSACGSAASNTSARGAVIVFNQDVADHRDTAACGLLTPTVRIILTATDQAARRPRTCASALESSGGRRFLAPLRMTGAQVRRAKVVAVGDGLVTVAPRAHATQSYVLGESHGRWTISGI